MNFVNKLNNTVELFNKLDRAIISETSYSILKERLINISDDLSNYKDVDTDSIRFQDIQNNDIKTKIENVLNRINQIELNVKNKLIITEKYSSYLNS